MIHDVDEALGALVRRDVLNGQSGIDVSFEAPTTDWSARRNTPTVNLFLYDITEDVKRREVMFERVVEDSGEVRARRLPPRRYALCYLVTAWTQRPEDEHRLLAALLGCFLQYPTMPRDLLPAALAAVGQELIVNVGLPRPEWRQAIDVWSSLGGELKPSLDLIVNAPIVLPEEHGVGPIVRELPRFAVTADGSDEEVQARRRRQGSGRPGAEPTAPDVVYAGSDAGVPARPADGSFGDGRPGRIWVVGQDPGAARSGRLRDEPGAEEVEHGS